MGKRKRTTIGFSYFMGLHMGLCRGPINGIAEIKIGGRVAYYAPLDVPWGVAADYIWPPNAAMPFPPSEAGNYAIMINKPDLFGGTKAEGGVDGTLRVLLGGSGQEAPMELKQMLGSPDEQPDFRGVTTVYFDGMICQMNPYPKPWRFLIRRTDAGWDTPVWYREKCTIYHTKPYDPAKPFDSGQYRRVQGMNAAHIIYEALTNPLWGRGLQASRLDGNSFRAAADTLYDEQMGLCLRWSRSDLLDTFIQTVLDHIAGVLYQSKITGLYTLKLLRNDYDFDTLPLYNTDNGILEINDASSGSTSEAVNEVIVNYRDPILDMEAQVRVQNIAAIQTTGSFATREVSYLGVPTDNLAMRLAQRDLKVASTNLRRFRIIADRRLWKVQPGDVIKINDVARSVGQIVLRVGTVDDGTLTNGRIDIVAVQDVFSYQLSPFGGIQPPLGTLPDYRPTAKRVLAYEKPYVELNTEYPPAEFEAIPDSAGIYNYHMERPSGLVLAYDIGAQRGAGEFVIDGSGDFTPMAAITGTLDYLDTVLVYSEVDNIHMEQVEVGQSAWIGEEFVRVDAIDLETRQVTIARGVMDTRPHRHFSGDLIWFTGDNGGTNYVNYAASETINLRGMPYSMQGGRLPLEDAPEEQVTMNWRMFRPYTPGLVTAESLSTPVNPWFSPVDMRHDAAGYWSGEPGQSPYIEVPDMLRLNWAHRDRTVQADQLIEHEVGDIGPEPGTTYRVRVLDAQGTVVRTISNILGTEVIYTYGNASIDLAVEESESDPVPGFLVLASVRDGLDSWQTYTTPINVYKLPPLEAQQVQVAQLSQQTMAEAETEDPATGVFTIQAAQVVLSEADGKDSTGTYVAQTSQQAVADEGYGSGFDNVSVESPYLLLTREGRNQSAPNLRVCISGPQDRVIEEVELRDRKYGTTEEFVPRGVYGFAPWVYVDPAEPFQTVLSVRPEYVRVRWGSGYRWIPDPTRPLTSERVGFQVPIPFREGMVGMYGDEVIEIEEVIRDSYGVAQLKVKRGCADTIPARHSIAYVWFFEDDVAVSNRLWGPYETAQYAMAPITFGPPVPIEALDMYILAMRNRAMRPYPPGLLLINGSHWINTGPSVGPDSELTITWAHRNRIWQGDQVYDHFDVGIPPEPGVRYRLNVMTLNGAQHTRLVDGNTVIMSHAELSRYVERYQYDLWLAGERKYPFVFSGNGAVPFQLFAERDGLVSWQAYTFNAGVKTTAGPGHPDTGAPNPGGSTGGGTGGNGGGTPGTGLPPDTGNGNTNPDTGGSTPPVPPEIPPVDETDPEFPDTGQPPIDPPVVVDPSNLSGWGQNWDAGWNGDPIPDEEV